MERGGKRGAMGTIRPRPRDHHGAPSWPILGRASALHRGLSRGGVRGAGVRRRLVHPLRSGAESPRPRPDQSPVDRRREPLRDGGAIGPRNVSKRAAGPLATTLRASRPDGRRHSPGERRGATCHKRRARRTRRRAPSLAKTARPAGLRPPPLADHSTAVAQGAMAAQATRHARVGATKAARPRPMSAAGYESRGRPAARSQPALGGKAGTKSVCPKSSPLKSSRSERALASA